MKPRTPEVTPQDDLFRSRLENLVSPRHPLVRLAERIDWDALNEWLGAYCEDAAVGQPPKPTRLMAGVLCLKHAYSLSDEALVERCGRTRTGRRFAVRSSFSMSRRSIRPA